MEIKLFKVESADSGSVYTIRMDTSDPSITKFKSQLALFVSIPPQDQILLIGPPYKRFGDPQLGPQSDVLPHPQRIFLYNRQVLTGEQSVPPSPLLFPMIVGVPDVDDATIGLTSNVSALLEKASSPLLRALPDFERQFLRNLKRGEHYLSISDQIVAACRRCVGEQGVQIDALQAALSNLRDHYATTKTAFETAQEKLLTQQEKHQALLDSFDSDLDRLRLTPLHSSLVNIVGGGEAVYSIAHTGHSMNVSSSTMQGIPTSPASPAFIGTRPRGYSIAEDEMGSKISNSTQGLIMGPNPGVRSVTPTMLHTPQQQQHQQQQKRDSFTVPMGGGPGVGGPGLNFGSLEVGSFDEAYPFQTGEISVGREEHVDTTQRVTLLDCVPAEKEKAWATQCGEVHKKVEEKLNQLLIVFRQVSAGLNNISVTPLDTFHFQMILKGLENDLQMQRSAMCKLREDYQFVYDTLSLRASMLTNPLGEEGGTGDGTPMASRRNSLQSSEKQDMISLSPGSTAMSERNDQKNDPNLSSTGKNAAHTQNTQNINLSLRQPNQTYSGIAKSTIHSSITGCNSEDLSSAILMSPSEKMSDLGSQSTAISPSTSSEVGASVKATEAVDEDGDVMALLKSLESRRKIQETDVISQMVMRCENMMTVKNEVAAKKGEIVGTVFTSMKAIASVQTDIQFKLKKGLELMKKWHQGHNKYFIHLEHVAKLTESYKGFLKELVRRKSFNQVYESTIVSLSSEVARLRVTETTAREHFMRTHGSHLPPIFFHMVPSLKDKPPYFDPRLTEAQWLPDVDSGLIDSNGELREGDDECAKESGDVGKGSTDGTAKEEGGSNVEETRTHTVDILPAPDESRAVSGSPTHTHISSALTPTPLSIHTQSIPHTSEKSNQMPVSTPDLTILPNTSEMRCKELELQNSVLLERLASMTAELQAAQNESAKLSSEKSHVGEERRADSTAVELIDTQLSTGPTSLIVSTEPYSLSAANISSSSSKAGIENNSDSESDAVLKRLQSIKTFLDTMAIKSILDSPTVEHASEKTEHSDSAWSVLRTNPSNIAGPFSSSLRGNVAMDPGSGPDAECGAEEVGAGPGSIVSQPGDAIETLTLLERVTRALLIRIEDQRSLLAKPQMTISYREFHVGSLALFMPLSPKMDVYLAFNSKCPHHYLSEESLHLIRSSDRRPPPRLDFIIGRVIFLEQLVAIHGNPYTLAAGSKYHLLHVEEIEPSRTSSTSSSSRNASNTNTNTNTTGATNTGAGIGPGFGTGTGTGGSSKSPPNSAGSGSGLGPGVGTGTVKSGSEKSLSPARK